MENSIPKPSPLLFLTQEINRVFQYFGQRSGIQVLGISENNFSITDLNNIRINLLKIVDYTDNINSKRFEYLKELEEDNKALGEKVKTLQEELENAWKEISFLKSNRINEHRNKGILIELLDKQQKEISGLKSNINDLQEQIKKLLQEIKNLKLEKEQVQNEKPRFILKKKALNEKISHLECKSQKYKEFFTISITMDGADLKDLSVEFFLFFLSVYSILKNKKMMEKEILDYFTTILKRKNVYLVDFSSIAFSKKDLIGKGGNGKVYKGLFLKSAVAIKEYTNFNVLEDYQNDEEVNFFIELMNNFKLNAPKINRCYGISLDSRGTVYSIHELAGQYLR